MTTIVTIQAVALVVLTLAVIGLLRSHAAIIRALNLGGDEHAHASSHNGASAGSHDHGAQPAHDHSTDVAKAREMPIPERAPEAADIVGVSPSTLKPVRVDVRGAKRDTLLAFLSTGCLSCEGFWKGIREGAAVPRNARIVAITKDPDEERATRVEKLSSKRAVTVMSSQAWVDYNVPMYPYFVYVDAASGEVRAGGAADTWEHVLALLDDSLEEIESRKGARVDDDDAALLAAGIGPGHPSLFRGVGGDDRGTER